MRLQPASLKSAENAFGKSLKNDREGVDATGILPIKTSA
jgi:hypothetical protein